MKRALLIAGGTVGGLGAVLSITPPQLNSQSAMGGLSNVASPATTTPVAQTTATTPTASTPVATTPSATATTPKATAVKKKVTQKKVAVAKVTTKTTTTATTTTPAASTPAAAATTPAASAPAPVAAPAPKKVSGTFTGSVVNVNYGNVQVQITVVDGKITNAQALQAPNGRSDRYTQYAIPVLRSQTLAAQGSNIQGASGASYTSYGWYTSLQSALAKAGL